MTTRLLLLGSEVLYVLYFHGGTCSSAAPPLPSRRWHRPWQGRQSWRGAGFGASPAGCNRSAISGSQPCPAALPRPARAAPSAAGSLLQQRQIRKFCEPFIVSSESGFCSAEADCSPGQFQVLTAGPPSPSSPPLPVWDERGEV